MTRNELTAKIIEHLKDADPELLRRGRAVAQVNSLLPLGWECTGVGHSAAEGWQVNIVWAPRNMTFYVRPAGWED